MAVHGITPTKSKEEQKSADSKLTDDQKKAMDIALERAKERKRLEFLKRKKG